MVAGSEIVAALVMQIEVQALGLGFVADPQPDQDIDHLQDQEGEQGRIGRGGNRSEELDRELAGEGHSLLEAAEPGRGEHTGHCAGGDAEDRGLAVLDPFHEHPGERGGGAACWRG